MSTHPGTSPPQSSCPAWEDYPAENEVYLAPGKDCSFYRQLLSQGATRIFKVDRIACELIRTVNNSEGNIDSSLDYETSNIPDVAPDSTNSSISTHQITSLDELGGKSFPPDNFANHTFYLIPQTFSWGQLQITRDALQRLLAQLRVFAPFLNVVNEFGSKTRDGSPKCDTFYGHSHRQPDGAKSAHIFTHHDHELSYLLHYVEENNRNHGDPWSSRQTGIYQQVKAKGHRSTWIFLKLSGASRRQVETVIQKEASGNTDGCMKLHSCLLLATVDNWGRYIDYLDTQLRGIDEKACFSKIGTDFPSDYSITFSDMQTLQQLRAEILKASSTLGSCSSLATRLKGHYFSLNLSTFSPSSSNEYTITSIETYATKIQIYQQNIARLAQSLQGTFDLLSNIIEFRNNQSLQATNTASEKSMFLLREAFSQAREENRAARSLATITQKDSKTIRALAMISTLFLPATLIATIFSSDLVKIQQNNTRGESFVLAKQFWIYVLISIGLTIVTIGCTRLLEGGRSLWSAPQTNTSLVP